MVDPRVVVITGGTAGVGRATAQRFARGGYRVAVLARGEDGLAATAKELEGLGAAGALAIRCDVADPDDVDAAALEIERDLGAIDVWINNAMTTVFARVADLAADEIRRVTEVTYLGVVWGTRAALARMRPRDRGTIVQVGSALAYRPIPLQAPYCAAKHAARAFTDALRAELLHDGSRVAVTMVHLPAINTPQFRWCRSKMPRRPQPVPPIFQPEIAADAIWHAAHHPHREIHLGAPTALAVLGDELAPGLLDHVAAHRAWDGQMTDEPSEPDRPSNLFTPIAGDHGAHGDFDDRARGRDPVAALTTWIGAAGVRAIAVALGGLAFVAAGAAIGRARGRRT
jgi:NAD(P)-dependent dehydrogenase (short-subunit alcohol dehydrogenase family)